MPLNTSQKLKEQYQLIPPHAQLVKEDIGRQSFYGEVRRYKPETIELMNNIQILSKMESGNFPKFYEGLPDGIKKGMINNHRKYVLYKISGFLMSVMYPDGAVPIGRRNVLTQTAIKLGRLDMDSSIKKNFRKLKLNRYEYEASLLTDAGLDTAVLEIIRTNFSPSEGQKKLLRDSLGNYFYFLIGNTGNHPNNRVLANSSFSREDNFIAALYREMTHPSYPIPEYPNTLDLTLLTSLQIKRGLEYEQTIERAGRFLYRLDKQAEGIKVDADGKISFQEMTLPDELSMEEYDRRFKFITDEFTPQNNATAAWMRTVPGVKDARVVMGSVIVSYNSSESTPYIEDLFPWITFDGEDSPASGGYFQEKNNFYLGLIGIDLNRKKLQSGGKTLSDIYSLIARHELDHHALNITNYLLAHDSVAPVLSAYDIKNYNTLNEILGLPQRIVNAEDAFHHDAVMYVFSSRERFSFDQNISDDIAELRYQQAYINESHSQYQDLQENWYKRKGLHYSMVTETQDMPTIAAVFNGIERNPTDIIARRLLASYMQVFKITLEMSIDMQNVILYNSVRNLLTESTAYLGVSKTLLQAEKLVRKQIKKLYATYPWLIESIRAHRRKTFPNPEDEEEYLMYVLYYPERL